MAKPQNAKKRGTSDGAMVTHSDGTQYPNHKHTYMPDMAPAEDGKAHYYCNDCGKPKSKKDM